MARKKDDPSRRPRKKEDKDLQELYAKMRKKFTAADLAKYTEIEETWVPLEQAIGEMEAIHREFKAKKRKR
jgi:hypothetical protein